MQVPTPVQALQHLDSLVSEMRLSRQQHRDAEVCVQVLGDLLMDAHQHTHTHEPPPGGEVAP